MFAAQANAVESALLVCRRHRTSYTHLICVVRLSSRRAGPGDASLACPALWYVAMPRRRDCQKAEIVRSKPNEVHIGTTHILFGPSSTSKTPSPSPSSSQYRPLKPASRRMRRKTGPFRQVVKAGRAVDMGGSDDRGLPPAPFAAVPRGRTPPNVTDHRTGVSLGAASALTLTRAAPDVPFGQ
jgi:hypothetical protein